MNIKLPTIEDQEYKELLRDLDSFDKKIDWLYKVYCKAVDDYVVDDESGDAWVECMRTRVKPYIRMAIAQKWLLEETP